MAVISFKGFKQGRGLILWDGFCPSPFHKEECIVNSECVFCYKKVELKEHPSYEGFKWYG